jgi:hypothetical protein
MSYVCSDFFVAELQSRCRAPSISCCCLSWRSFRWNEINSKLKRWMIQLEYCNQLEGKNKNNWKVSQSQSPYIINTILCVGWCVCWPLEFTNMMDNMNEHSSSHRDLFPHWIRQHMGGQPMDNMAIIARGQVHHPRHSVSPCVTHFEA